MWYVLIVKDAPIEEICGVTDDEVYAKWWVSEALGGIAPKRIYREFPTEAVVLSTLEHRWESNASA